MFNFDVPGHSEDYVHRIGRTGRAGRTGKAFMIVTPSDEKAFAAIEDLVKQEIPRGENPLDARKAAKSTPAKADEDTPEAAAEPKPTSKSRSRAAEPEPKAQEEKPAKKPRGRGGRGGRGRDEPVVGLGDHVPDFIARSFGERRTG